MRRIMTDVIAVILIALTLPSAMAPAVEIAKVGDTILEPRALTIVGNFGNCINGKAFQQDPLRTHQGYQYAAFYDADRWVCLGRRALPDGPWEVIRFTDYAFKSNDSHNTISLGICPTDGTIHLAFDHHGHPLHYRVSKQGVANAPAETPWDPSLFGPVQSEVEVGKPIKITYPRFWPTPDGGLQFCYRRGGSGNGDRMLVDYDAAQGIWKNTRAIDSHAGTWNGSDSRCSYPNGYTYDARGRLHATWVWREGAQTANHDLIYVYSDDRGNTWKNGVGDAIARPPAVDSPCITAVEISDKLGLMNTHGQAVDSEGRIHVVLRHPTEASLQAAGTAPGESTWGPPEAQRYHHYWRDTAGIWHHREIPVVTGNRPKILVDAANNAYIIYTAAEGVCIAEATVKADWSDWHLVYTEPGPFISEILPDPVRWISEGVVSVLAQEPPAAPHAPSALRVLDVAVRPGA